MLNEIKKIRNRILYGKQVLSNHEVAIYKSMRVFKKHNALFIHIPKSAGISVYYGIFKKESFGHMPLSLYIEKYGKNYIDNLFKFTIVRNPYDRLYSAYNYLKQGGRKKEIDLKYQSQLLLYENFEQFVLDIFKSNKYLKIEHLVPQVNWIKNVEGQIQLDYLGHFENLENDYTNIVLRLGKNTKNHKLITKNKTSNKKEYILTPGMIEIINKIYKEDFEMLGYKMKDGFTS